MPRIWLHLMGRLCAWSGLGLAGATLVVLSTQSLRLMPLWSAAGASLTELLRFCALSAVPILGWSAAPAACLSLLVVAGQMEEHGERVALEANGIGPRRLLPAVGAWLALLVLLTGAVALYGGPLAGARLRAIALHLSARAVVGGLVPGELTAVAPGLTLRAMERGPEGELLQLFIADDRTASRRLQIAAASGKLAVDSSGSHLSCQMNRGTAFVLGPNHEPVAAISFESLKLELPAATIVEQGAGFLPPMLVAPTSELLGPRPPQVKPSDWTYALWRRFASIAAVLVLGLAAGLLTQSGAARRRLLGLLAAIGLFVAYHLAARAAEQLMHAGALGAIAAASAPLLVPLLLAGVAARWVRTHCSV